MLNRITLQNDDDLYKVEVVFRVDGGTDLPDVEAIIVNGKELSFSSHDSLVMLKQATNIMDALSVIISRNIEDMK